MTSEVTLCATGGVGDGNVEAALEAQFFEHDAPENLLPFAEAAVTAAGCGSVEVNLSGNKGLLLVLPRPLLTTLRSSFRTMLDSGAPEFQRNVLYQPPVKLSDNQGQEHAAAALLRSIEGLGLCPPDMRIQGPVPTRNGFFLMVSGPENRKDHYTSTVNVDLKKLVEAT